MADSADVELPSRSQPVPDGEIQEQSVSLSCCILHAAKPRELQSTIKALQRIFSLSP